MCRTFFYKHIEETPKEINPTGLKSVRIHGPLTKHHTYVKLYFTYSYLAQVVLIVEKGKISNGHIVLSKPLSLPEGTEVRVQIEPVDPVVVSDTDSQDKGSDESEDFANLPCFGMWADREDMRDSVAWMRKQREKW